MHKDTKTYMDKTKTYVENKYEKCVLEAIIIRHVKGITLCQLTHLEFNKCVF